MFRTALGYTAEVIGFMCLVVASYRLSLTLALAVLGAGLIFGAQAAKS